MADPTELVLQAVVGLAAAAIGAGATVWTTTRSLRRAAETDRRQRRDQELGQRRATLETAASELELSAILLSDGRFETQSSYIRLPQGALDRVLEYLSVLPSDTATAVQQAALRTAVYNSYAAASLYPGGKVAAAVARKVATDAASAVTIAAALLRAYLEADNRRRIQSAEGAESQN